ncbi:hypothetical protein [Sabulicella rubraurantiaca]|uniref:hypothetical protein n=1 Tax=Sabulicella rubraurantiaca TaxID=2811429 RepID=UPI001A95737A|nr:hypothetical protein [Sabulicella rubraurantiaca]
MAALSEAWVWLQSVEGRTWAAWVQAIGSVLGILVAARLASSHARTLAQHELDEGRNLRKGVALLAQNLAKLLAMAHHALSDPQRARRISVGTIPSIENILAALRSVDFRVTRDGELVFEVQTLIQYGLTAVEIFRSVSERPPGSEFAQSDLDEINDIIEVLRKVVSEIDMRELRIA